MPTELFDVSHVAIAAVALVSLLGIVRLYSGSVLLQLQYVHFWGNARAIFMPVIDRLAKRLVGISAENHALKNEHVADRDADTHVDVVEIADHFEPQSFDTIIFDPPFDEKQAETKYDGLHAMDVYAALEQFNELVRAGGKVICFGWNS